MDPEQMRARGGEKEGEESEEGRGAERGGSKHSWGIERCLEVTKDAKRRNMMKTTVIVSVISCQPSNCAARSTHLAPV